MKKEDYYIFKTGSISDGPIIKHDLEEGPQNWEFLENESLLDEFPEIGILKLSQENDSTELYDFIDNMSGIHIISEKVKLIMIDHGLTSSQVEYLPVTIKDQRGDILSTKYYMLNYINAQPIINMKKSEYELSSFDETQISTVNKMELDLTNVNSTAKVFHPSSYKNITVIDSTLLNTFREANITNFWTIPAQGWDGLTLLHNKDYMNDMINQTKKNN